MPELDDREHRRSITELLKQLQLKTSDSGLYEQALTHSSYINEASQPVQDNERLEYLGDSVLGLVVNEYLFHTLPDAEEGDLARIKSAVVSEKGLHLIAREIGLGDFLRMGRGERRSGGATRPSILADALEALIAAVYLTLGMDRARDFVLEWLRPGIEKARDEARDPKSELQEYTQRTRHIMPTYETVSESGPKHAPKFVCRVVIEDRELGRGEASSRRGAERRAARAALEILRAESGKKQ